MSPYYESSSAMIPRPHSHRPRPEESDWSMMRHPDNNNYDDIVEDAVGPPPLDPMESGGGASFVMDQYKYKQRAPLNLDMFRHRHDDGHHQKPKQPPSQFYDTRTTTPTTNSYLPVYVPPNDAPTHNADAAPPMMLASKFDGIRGGDSPRGGLQLAHPISSSSSHEKLDIGNGMKMFQRDAILFDDYATNSGFDKDNENDKKDNRKNSTSWKQKMPPKAKEIYWKGSRTPLMPSTTVTKPAPATRKAPPPPPPAPPAVVSPCRPSHKRNHDEDHHHPRQSLREDNYYDHHPHHHQHPDTSSSNFHPQSLANLKRDSFYDSSHHHSVIEEEEQQPIRYPLREEYEHPQPQPQPQQQQQQRWKLTTQQTSSKMDSINASLCTLSFPSFYNASFHTAGSTSESNPAEPELEEPTTTTPGEHEQPQPQMIEIAPGVTAALRGAKETSLAVGQNYITGVTCWGCQQNVFCVADCLYAICPLCKTISPNDDANPTNHGLGLALSRDALHSLQSEIFG